MHEKPASQHRSREKRDRILAALDTLLKRRSFADISVQDLAREAGVSPATLYQRFSNADVLGAVLLALYYTRIEEWAHRPRRAATAANAGLAAALAAIATDAWEQVVALGHIMRPAYLYSRQHPGRAGADWQRLEQAARTGFLAFLQGRAAHLPAQDLDESARVICLLFNSLLLGPLLHGEEPPWKTRRGRDFFVGTVATLAERYLACPR